MKRKIIQLPVLLCVMLCQSACTDKQPDVDEFYTQKGGFDFARIPLIKPYEAVVPATGNEYWLIHSVTDTLLFSIPGVKQLSVSDNKMIFVHGVNTAINYQNVKEGWFVLMPAKNLVKAFLKHENYLNWLHDHGIEKEPHLIDPDNIYRYFKNHDTIDWQEINKRR
ncbi:hypothetical protein GWR56_04230 [Mucilaginibacter sp. 14171R-50]|uniref:hypothetical protein n=1 Tax=Mucilaginibacter sp. 14171R-50 TaxID=2703789 RepID=UPI00138D4B38|nr:hypothetical protein [Mucilaginibacter sp. 14171R-50]QHS54791.1 hypothetical protein GWR56_04230 [Mucilaginibacter sp. 14171R-50]